MTTDPIFLIRDETSYKAAVAEVGKLWGAEGGSPKGDRLDVLLVLVEAYEAQHHAIQNPDPVEAIKIRMEDLGLDREDLGGMLGVPSGRVSEILNRRRRLTLDMIRTLTTELKLSEACLLQPYDLVPPTPAGERRKQKAGTTA